MIERERGWDPGHFATLDEEQQAALLALQEVEWKEETDRQKRAAKAREAALAAARKPKGRR